MATKTSKPAPKGKSDTELGFMDDVPVMMLNGDNTTLGDMDPSPVVTDTPEPAQAKPAQPVKTKAAPKSKNGKVATTLKKASGKAVEKHNETISEAKRLRLEAAEKRKAEKDAKKAAFQARKDNAAKKKADIAQRKADRAAAAERRAADKVARAAARLEKQGLTGDPEADAAFLATLEESRALTVAQAPANALSLDFLQLPGVDFRRTGLVLPDDLPIQAWAHTLAELDKVKDVGQWAIGDALAFGEGHYLNNQYAKVSETLGVSSHTTDIYKMVAKGYPIDARIDGLSFNHHYEALSLYRTNPALALNLLEQAYEEIRPTSWLREQIRKARQDSGEGEATTLQKQQAKRDALLMVTDEEYEAAHAELKTHAQVWKRTRDEALAIIEDARTHDAVESVPVTRVIALLNAEIVRLQDENLRLRREVTDLRLAEQHRAEANARVTGAATDGATQVVAGEVSDDDLDLSFMDELGEETKA